MRWCSICMKRRLFVLMYGVIKCLLVVFVHPLHKGNLVRNYGVAKFRRFLKDTWNRYGMVLGREEGLECKIHEEEARLEKVSV